MVLDVTRFLLQKVPKNGVRKVDAVARSIEHDLLSVEPWEVRKKCSDFTTKTLPKVSR